MELNILEIEKIIPHGFPFLVIDRITDLQSSVRLIGLKNV